MSDDSKPYWMSQGGKSHKMLVWLTDEEVKEHRQRGWVIEPYDPDTGPVPK